MSSITLDINDSATTVDITEIDSNVAITTQTTNVATVENVINVDVTESITNVDITNTYVDVDVTETTNEITLGTNYVIERETGLEVDLQSESYYVTPTTSAASRSFTLNYVYYTPIIIAKTTTLSRIGVMLITTALSNTVKLGIYTNSNENKPETKLDETSAIQTGTGQSTGFKYGEIDVTLNKGLYWLAFLNQGSVPSTFYSSNFVNYFMPQGTFDSPPLTIRLQYNGWTQTGVTGDLPTTPSVQLLDSSNFPRIYIGVA